MFLNCAVVVYVLDRFLTLPWVGLQSVIMRVSGHAHVFMKKLCLSSGDK